MKIVIVSLYKVFPPVFGAATLTYNIAKKLPEEKILIQIVDKEDDSVINDSIKLINIRHISGGYFIKMISLFFNFPTIVKIIKDLDPDFIIMESASWSLYYLILFYLIKFKRVKAKIIYHAHNVEYLLRKQKNNIIIATLTRLAEYILLKRTDLFFAVSEIDSVYFEKLYGLKPKVLSSGINAELFDKVTSEDMNNIRVKYGLYGKLVLFMGLTDYKPNKQAIDFLINKVFPIVIKSRLDAKLVIIGGKTKYKKEWLLNPGNIPFTEIPSFIKACDVCVAPIFTGSGVRIKILEYLAAAKPVVSTYKGIEGIRVKEGDGVLIANEIDSFAEKILYLLDKTEIAEKIAQKGKLFVQENYSYQKIISDFNKILYSYQSTII